jgi:hypothetical protein
MLLLLLLMLCQKTVQAPEAQTLEAHCQRLLLLRQRQRLLWLM